MNEIVNITTVIKAKNEESQIAEAIRSAFYISDVVIVVDDDSSDRTADIAIEHGAQVLKGCFHGGEIDKLDYLGFSQVKSGWILRMDADERITQELAGALLKVVQDGRYSGARFARLHVMFGEPVFGGGWFRPFQLAFFRSDSWDRSWKAGLHSQVPVKGKIQTIRPDIAHSIHFDYRTIEEFTLRSLLGYAKVDAYQKFADGERFSKSNLLCKPWTKFFGRFFIRGGYKDGNRGLVLAALLAAYEISVACFLWQLGEENREPLAGE